MHWMSPRTFLSLARSDCVPPGKECMLFLFMEVGGAAFAGPCPFSDPNETPQGSAVEITQ